MVGKTFKGLTDELLAWQTEEFPRHESHRTDWVVHLRPHLVVEIALDGVQVSSRYPGGVALRFARVVRYRPDKQPTGGRHHRRRARHAAHSVHKGATRSVRCHRPRRVSRPVTQVSRPVTRANRPVASASRLAARYRRRNRARSRGLAEPGRPRHGPAQDRGNRQKPPLG